MLHCGEMGRGVSEAGTQHGGDGPRTDQAQRSPPGAREPETHRRQGAALAEFRAKHLKTKEREPGQSRGLSSVGKPFRDTPF